MGNHSSTLPKKTTTAATNRENAIESEKRPPGWMTLNWLVGKGDLLSRVHTSRMALAQGGSPADVDVEDWTVENRISLRERMRIGTWNVMTMNQGKLDMMKREMERTGVERMGISAMR